MKHRIIAFFVEKTGEGPKFSYEAQNTETLETKIIDINTADLQNLSSALEQVFRELE